MKNTKRIEAQGSSLLLQTVKKLNPSGLVRNVLNIERLSNLSKQLAECVKFLCQLQSQRVAEYFKHLKNSGQINKRDSAKIRAIWQRFKNLQNKAEKLQNFNPEGSKEFKNFRTLSVRSLILKRVRQIEKIKQLEQTAKKEKAKACEFFKVWEF